MSQYSENKFYDSDNHSWGIIYRYVKDGSTILDIGCSSGTLGEVLIKNKECIVDGIEPFHQDAVIAARKLRKVYEMDVEHGDLAKLDQKYDYIIFADVIEHLVDPVATLKNIKSLLKPEGVVLYSIPNMAHISIRLSLLHGNFDHSETGLLDKTHLHFYTNDQIARTFKDAGYSIEEQKYTYVVYPKKFVTEALESLGLKAESDKIYKMLLDDAEAQAFQYIGVAKPGPKSAARKPITVLPHQIDAQKVNELIEFSQKDVKILTKEVQKNEQKIAELQHAVDILRAETSRMGYRLIKKGYSALDSSRRKIKRHN